MSLFAIILALAAIGVILYFVNKTTWIENWVKKAINIVAVVVVVIWLLKISGLWAELWKIRL